MRIVDRVYREPGRRRSVREWWTPSYLRRSSFRNRMLYRLCRAGYSLGVLSGWGTSWSGGDPVVVDSWTFTGHRLADGRRARPCYVLGVQWVEWGCMLRRHHWPSPDKIAFGMCSKCIPCPECGSPGPLDHDCPALVEPAGGWPTGGGVVQ